MRTTVAPLLITLAVAFAHSARASGSEAIATITAPTLGQHVNGMVHILGSATHQAFDHYELHFALDPNPTDTWFPIMLAGANPVENGQLGQWDTGSISTGNYMLRLQVVGSDDSLPTETVVTGIAVRSGPVPPTPTPIPTVVTTITPAPVPTRAMPKPALRSLFPQLREKHDYRSTFVNSAAYSVTAFMGLGVYLQLRKLVRPHVRRLMRKVRSDLRRP